jgi:phospholipase C
LTVACSGEEADSGDDPLTLPSGDIASVDPESSLELAARPARIEHVVVVMMENRSFDHMVGWVPGADGEQAGLTFTDESGASFPTHELAPDFQGCGFADPDHSYDGGRVELNGGACDGWLRAGDNDEYSIGYYSRPDLAFYSQAVRRGVTLDRYFSAIMAETFPNRIYQHAAQTDRITNTLDISVLPTIWDRLADAGLTGRYYYSDLPVLALWGSRYLSISRPVAEFVTDAMTGNLPQVAFVDPRFLGEAEGVSADDHPFADIRDGQAFLNLVYRAVAHSPQRRSTVLVINYDEWGGFFDHVAPPTAPIPPADQAAGNLDGLLGFRTPALVFAPWVAPGTVAHEQFDHTSVLKMIEERWGLEPLTVRDATANNLADVLDFSRKSAPAPDLDVPPGPFGRPCAIQAPIDEDDETELTDLALLATQFGWTIPTDTVGDLAALLQQLLDLRP